MEAEFYKKLAKNVVKCELCYHHCVIKQGFYGKCLARKNEKGKLISEVYGKIAAEQIDPIEKKPLYHFFPGTNTYSIGTCGCNFHCEFCQNCEISRTKTINYPYIKESTPEQVVKNGKLSNCKSISYTYNEPTVNYEFALKTSKLSNKIGIKNVFVTNGYIEKKPLKKISPYLDAANIDLKSFNKDFYKKTCGADLNKVLETIKEYKKRKIHIELTTLLVPKINDSIKEITSLSKWVYENLGPNIPVHFSRFFPQYLMQKTPSTQLVQIRKAVSIARKVGINYVYGGNIIERKLVNTYCHNCGTELIDRMRNVILIKNLEGDVCKKCGEKQLLYY